MSDKKDNDKNEILHCSFCGKSQDEVKKLVAGRGVYICDECIDLCNDIIRDIARKQKYDLIVQEAVYVGPNVDITDEVIKALGSGKK